MILDKENGWLFLKTGKVAGTSVEIALSRLVSPASIITPNMPKEEELRKSLGYREARGYKLPITEYTIGQFLRRAIRGRRPQDVFWDHISASEIRDRIGGQVFDGLFKFSIVRNPFDEAVSRWRWYTKRFGKSIGTFERFIFDHPESIVTNRLRISIDGSNVMDKMIRFENLVDDFRSVSDRLNLDEQFFTDLKTLRLKSNRPTARLPTPAEVYDTAPGTEDVVRLLSREVISTYGYTGPTGADSTKGGSGLE